MAGTDYLSQALNITYGPGAGAGPQYPTAIGMSDGDVTAFKQQWDAVNAFLASLSPDQRNLVMADIAELPSITPGFDIQGVTLTDLEHVYVAITQTPGLDKSALSSLGTTWAAVQPAAIANAKSAAAKAAQPNPDQQSAGALQSQELTTTAGAPFPEQNVPKQGGGTMLSGEAAAKLNTAYENAPDFLLTGVDPNDPNALAAALGVDPAQLQSQYRDYTQNYQRALQRNADVNTPRPVGTQPLSLEQYARELAASQAQQWLPALDMMAFWYQQQTGQAMPVALRQNLLTAFRSLPKNQSDYVLHNMYQAVLNMQTSQKTAAGQGVPADPSTWTSSFMTAVQQYAPSIYGGSLTTSGTTIGNFVQSNPLLGTVEAQTQGTERSNAIALLTQFGIPPTTDLVNSMIQNPSFYQDLSTYLPFMHDNGVPVTADAINTLLSMPFGDPTKGTAPPDSGGAWILAQKSNITGLSVGQKVSAYNALSSQWQTWFGTGSSPSEQALRWAVGKNAADIQDFFWNSNSRIPGVTLGEYQDYMNFIYETDKGGSTTHAFSSAIDDSLIADLHAHLTSQSTGTAAPPAGFNAPAASNPANPANTPPVPRAMQTGAAGGGGY